MNTTKLFEEYKKKDHLSKDLNKFGKIINDDGYINIELLFSILQNLEEEILSLKEQLVWKSDDIRDLQNKIKDLEPLSW